MLEIPQSRRYKLAQKIRKSLTYGNHGINYYHESMGYLGKTNSEIDTDFLRIHEKYNNIKIYFNPYNQDNLANCKNICEKAKAAGFYVIWIENNDNTNLTDANWSGYSDQVVLDAAQAEDSGADEFIVGNEISIHNNGDPGFDDGNLETRIKDLITACGSNFTGLYGFQDGWWKKDTWNNSGLGNVDKIYFTLYENISDFETYANDIWSKFGSNARIGEWSTQSTMDSISGTDEEDWKNRLSNRQDILDSLGIEHYVFCYRDTGVGNNNRGYGLWKYTIDEPHYIWNFL